MLPHNITLSEARDLIIERQLLNKKKSDNCMNQLLQIIETLGYIQIDTISVVERSHHHILWSRLDKYKHSMTDELINERKIFEYWSHAAAYLPMKDFRFSLLRKKRYSDKYKTWGKANRKVIKYVYDRIKSEGPLQSRDFEGDGNKTSGWWNWKPAKDALDFLFHKGDLMISERKGFQKVYDLSERVLTEHTDTSFPSEEEFYEHLITKSVNSNGIISGKEIAYQRRVNSAVFETVLNSMTEKKQIRKIRIHGTEQDYFTTDNILDQKNKNLRTNNSLHILSPFDNILINRKRLKEIFDFDYTIECYVPQTKRVYGYYCLPILYGNKFVGRLDAKADRASGEFVLKSIYFEDKAKLRSTFKSQFENKLLKFAKFSGCSSIIGLDKLV